MDKTKITRLGHGGKRHPTRSNASTWFLILAAGPAALFGALTAYVSISNANLPKPPAPPEQLVFRDGEDHPVTREMAKVAKEMGGAKAAPFQAVDLNGANVSLASLTKGKPLVLFFVELQCPCCKGAKPYIDRIQDYYHDACNVVGVIDASPKMAKLWSEAVRPEFPIIPDPKMDIIRAFQAQRGVYTTLVSPGGRIVKAYPGYSQDMLRDITDKIERLSGIAHRPMPVLPAPKTMTSGCIFPGTKLPDDQI